MDRQDFNKAEDAVNDVKWTVNDYADRAKDYIREQKEKNAKPTAEGWLERAKENVSEAWEDTKDAVSDAWEKTKDLADNTWEKTKDAAEDAKAEVRKATN
ncbi:hypothetical protein J4771_09940 [Candidatus Kaistella beijingensis]|uniref:hypothetical protein n=1 Tax=Candidatus Kaistella beijingensis TaxID=2820270 RepID=UPI001CC47910|nr:hypothetical protein [Candidatus Kaistella beijingensis]UBB89184.1 hypothetical protein J4771_09940 [Candidatus Kaistella beijingensis]